MGFQQRQDTQPNTPAKPDDHPGRSGSVMIGFYIPKPAHRQLKQLCLNQDSTQQEILSAALNEVFKKNGMPPIE
jgi:hypothetical protein